MRAWPFIVATLPDVSNLVDEPGYHQSLRAADVVHDLSGRALIPRFRCRHRGLESLVWQE